jgi:hypothetical protein
MGTRAWNACRRTNMIVKRQVKLLVVLLVLALAVEVTVLGVQFYKAYAPSQPQGLRITVRP